MLEIGASSFKWNWNEIFSYHISALLQVCKAEENLAFKNLSFQFSQLY